MFKMTIFGLIFLILIKITIKTVIMETITIQKHYIKNLLK